MLVNRRVSEHWSDAIGAAGAVISYGHWGRAVLVFPSEQGRAGDFEDNGMIGAVAGLIEAGRLKVYCVDSYDARSWSSSDVPLEERARRHGRYESWIVDVVVPWITQDCGGTAAIAALGCSLGAFHSANFALKRADLFPLAMCFSGNYDPATWNGWGERGMQAYFNNPMDYVGHASGDHLDWLRSQVSPAGPSHAAILLRPSTKGALRDSHQAPDRVVARDRGRLAQGICGDSAQARPGQRPRRDKARV